MSAWPSARMLAVNRHGSERSSASVRATNALSVVSSASRMRATVPTFTAFSRTTTRRSATRWAARSVSASGPSTETTSSESRGMARSVERMALSTVAPAR